MSEILEPTTSDELGELLASIGTRIEEVEAHAAEIPARRRDWSFRAALGDSESRSKKLGFICRSLGLSVGGA